MNLEALERYLSRRDFLKLSVAGALAMALPGRRLFGAEQAEATDVWVLHGKDKKALMTRCMEIIFDNGGYGKKARKVALKVNAAWTRTPVQGANTHPDLVDVFIAESLGSGIKEVVIPEHPCRPARESFPRSGILQVAEKHKQKMVDLKTDTSSFREVELPKAKKLLKAKVSALYLDADALVNIPVAKHHSGAKLTMAMKNWMGAVQDRRFWHRNDLHQCIADFSTFIRPTWTVIDATRTMMDRGPQGPTKNMKTPDLLVLSRDQVAADAYASTLFHDSINAVKYLRIARDSKIGQTDITKMNVRKVEVA